MSSPYFLAFRAAREVLVTMEAQLRDNGLFENLTEFKRQNLQRHYCMMATLVFSVCGVPPGKDDFALDRIFVRKDGTLDFDVDAAIAAGGSAASSTSPRKQWQ